MPAASLALAGPTARAGDRPRVGRVVVLLVTCLTAASLFFTVAFNYRRFPGITVDGSAGSPWVRSLKHWNEHGFFGSCGLIYLHPTLYHGIPGWNPRQTVDAVVYHNAGPAFLLPQYPWQKIHYARTGAFSEVLLAANALLFAILGAVFLGLLAFEILVANGFTVRAATLMALAAALVYQNFGGNLIAVRDFHPPSAGVNVLLAVMYLLYRYSATADAAARRRLRRATAVAFFAWASVDFVVIPLFFLLVWALALYLRHASLKDIWLRGGLGPTLAAYLVLSVQLACGRFVIHADFVGSSLLFRTGLDGNTYARSHAAIWPLFFDPGALRWWLSLIPFAIPFYALLLGYRFWWVTRPPRGDAAGPSAPPPALTQAIDLVSLVMALGVLYFAVFSQHVLLHSGLNFTSHVFTIYLFVPSVLIVCVVFPALLKRTGVNPNAVAYAWILGGTTCVWASWRLYTMGAW